MAFKKEDLVIAIIGLSIILYVLWYLFTHSPEFVSYSDLFTVHGGMLAFLGLFLNRLYTSIDRIEERMNVSVDRIENKMNASIDRIEEKIDRVEDKINDLTKEFIYFKIEEQKKVKKNFTSRCFS